MRTQDARRIPLKDLLARLGHHPTSETAQELWYRSPFREESKPSFHINLARNIWYDFGLNAGGNVIDLVMRYQRTSSVSVALKHLDDMGSWSGVLAQPASPPAAKASLPPSSSRLTVEKIQPLQHWGLKDYLRKRGIEPSLAKRYVQEIYYRVTESQAKPYFALAFPNRTADGASGYELRSAYFQGVHGAKDLSLITASMQQPSQVVCVFEGFMDMLAYLTWQQQDVATTDLIVLNGVAMGERAIETIQQQDYDEVHLYLDRDPAGETLTGEMQQALAQPQRSVLDASTLYEGYKDFNAYLLSPEQQASPRYAPER